MRRPWGPYTDDAWPPVPTSGVYGTYYEWRRMRLWLREHSGVFQRARPGSDEAGER